MVLDKVMTSYSRSLTVSEYKLSVLSDFPDLDNLLLQIEEADIAPEMFQERLKTLQERSLAYDLTLALIDVTEGRKTLSEVSALMQQVEDIEEKIETEFVTDDLEEIYNDTVHIPGLKWRLPSLNESLGSLRKGDFGFVFARPETGKTTFLASEVSYFAEQAERPILWFNNEEGGKKVKARIFQASLGLTLPELYSDRKKSYNDYIYRTKGNILLYDNATATKRNIEKIIKDINPSLVIFDQIDKIKGFNADRNDLRLGSIYIWARELAKSYCPIIGVCQSDVSGEGKKWLTMDNVAESKTAKQAEADFILGIGATHEIGMEFVRYLHLSKNKLSGDETSDPSLRHGRMEVLIDPQRARYKEI